MHPDPSIQLRYDCLVLAVSHGDITVNYSDQEVVDLADKFYNFVIKGTTGTTGTTGATNESV